MLKTIERCLICNRENVETYSTRYKYCRECILDMQRNYNYKGKSWAVEYKGGKCEKCGYNEFLPALDFHHIDPEQKEFSFSSISNFERTDALLRELDKCILLCCRCHRELHILQEMNKICNTYISQKERQENSLRTVTCINCENDFKCKKTRKRVYCSVECQIDARTKQVINSETGQQGYPSKEELQDLINSTPFTTIGKIYNVSDNAIRKWCKKYGIQKDPNSVIKTGKRKAFLALQPDGTKICGKCYRKMFERDFSSDRASIDGLSGFCRGCDAERKRIARTQCTHTC